MLSYRSGEIIHMLSKTSLEINNKVISSVQILSIFCMIFTILIWQVWGFHFLSLLVPLIEMLATIFCTIMAIRLDIIGQFLNNMVIGFVLKGCSLIVLLNNLAEIEQSIGNISAKIICTFVSIGFIFYTIYCASIVAHLKIRRYLKSIWKMNWQNVFFVGLFLCIMMIIVSPFFHLWPRWDSFHYYFSWQKVSIRNLFQANPDGLIVCSHPANAYILWTFLFKTIPNITDVDVLYLSNIFLLFLDYLISYCIFKRIFKLKLDFIYPVFSFVFICSPYILGSVTGICPDYMEVTGLLLFLWGMLSSNYYACIIACYVACNTRETGIPIMAIMILIQLIYDVYKIKKENKKFCSILWLDKWIYYFSSFIIGVMSVVDIFASNWVANVKNVELERYYNDGTEMFSYGFSALYIWNQLKGLFLTNLTWIYVLIIIISLFVFIRYNKRYVLKSLLRNQLYITILGGVAVAVAELCIFITYHAYRYYSPVIMFLQILAISGFVNMSSKIRNNEFIKNVPIILLGGLLLIQCYTTIDPIMLSVFPTIITGNERLVVMSWHVNHVSDPQFIEPARYNFQIPYFDKALNVLYSKIDPNNSKVLLYDGYQWESEATGNTLNSIWGGGYEFLDPPSWGVWNSEGKYRELSHNPDYIINPIPISDYTQVAQYSQEYENLYYLELPWGDELISVLKENCLGMELCETIKYHGWVLKLYKF